MSTGTCQLCLRTAELQRSHIIPNALFRRIKQLNAGKVIHFDDLPASVAGYSIDSWSEPLFCSQCEQFFSGFEKQALETLRKPLNKCMERDGGVLLETDYRTLKIFFTSLLWRSAISTLAPFAKVVLFSDLREEIRKSLVAGLALPPQELACRLELLFDPTPVAKGRFRDESLQQLIISPIPRQRTRYSSYLFLLEGYVVEIFVPSAPYSAWREMGILKDQPKLFVPPRNIFDVPELNDLLVAGHRKIVLGLSSVPEK